MILPMHQPAVAILSALTRIFSTTSGGRLRPEIVSGSGIVFQCPDYSSISRHSETLTGGNGFGTLNHLLIGPNPEAQQCLGLCIGRDKHSN
jgi:hypothetical protein